MFGVVEDVNVSCLREGWGPKVLEVVGQEDIDITVDACGGVQTVSGVG